MTKTAKPTSTAPEALMLDIAKRHFLVETLDTRNSDRLPRPMTGLASVEGAHAARHSARRPR